MRSVALDERRVVLQEKVNAIADCIILINNQPSIDRKTVKRTLLLLEQISDLAEQITILINDMLRE